MGHMQLQKRWAAVALRVAKKLSQAEMAEIAGVSLSTVKRFELGASVSGLHQESILRALGGGLELLAVTDVSPPAPVRVRPRVKSGQTVIAPKSRTGAAG